MKFCTVLSCMDGRIQLPVINFLKDRFNVEYVDNITEAGINKIIHEDINHSLIDSIYERIDISINLHFSKSLAVVGHFDCAKNPTDRDTQTAQSMSTIKKLKVKYPNIEIIGLWVNENWEVVELAE